MGRVQLADAYLLGNKVDPGENDVPRNCAGGATGRLVELVDLGLEAQGNAPAGYAIVAATGVPYAPLAQVLPGDEWQPLEHRQVLYRRRLVCAGNWCWPALRGWLRKQPCQTVVGVRASEVDF
ncbi:MAG: hypothetical protein IPM36_23950 [Lewinellaceae bacterium]|nr:hypothetical protein [Lewinellaceae bacterium]